MSKKYKKLLLVFFIFYLVLFLLSPICGDDWSNYLVGKTGLYHSFGNAVGMYFDWEGRLVSRVLINILTYHKILWCIINSLLITVFIYMSIKLFKLKKDNYTYLLIFLIIPLMNILTFSQTFTWVAGNITYFFVISLILIYFYIIYKDLYSNNKLYILLLLLGITIPMFVEHMALVSIIGTITLIIYKYFKTKRIDKKLIVLLILVITSTLSMLLSPGTRMRSLTENEMFNKLSMLEKVLYNYPNFIYYTFIINPYLLLLMIISNIYLIKKYIKNNILKVLIIIFMTIIPIITIVLYTPLMFTSSYFINFNSIPFIIYYSIYLIISIFLHIKENNKISIFLLLIGISANLAMLLSPTWGFRTSLFTYVILSLANILIINKYGKYNKIIHNILRIVVLVSFIFYLILYINIYLCNKDREQYMEKQIKDNKDTIEIIKLPDYVNCNINPDNEFHIRTFKEYYNIPIDKNIKLVDSNWKYLIIYKKSY